MNVIIVLVPLIGTIFGVMYYYNSREFTQLLLAQPIKRTHIFLGQYLGVAASLSLSILIGIGLPFIAYGIFGSTEIWNYFTLLLIGVFLSFIFSAIAFLIALKNENRIKGFGLAILVWLFFAVIYDGLFLFKCPNHRPKSNRSLGTRTKSGDPWRNNFNCAFWCHCPFWWHLLGQVDQFGGQYCRQMDIEQGW